MSWIRRAPVTAESIIVCMTIYASCLLQANANSERFDSVQRQWGAIRTLRTVDSQRIRNRRVSVTMAQSLNSPKWLGDADVGRASNELQPSGPFDVWNGEWWRIPLTVFHHESLMHLVLGLGGIWYLGSRIERFWGSSLTFVFFVTAACLPVMSELVFGRAFVGMSGIVCALFGALLVLRDFDSVVAESFGDDAVEVGLLILGLFSITAVYSEQFSLYVAHWVGFAYGGVAATIISGRFRRFFTLRMLFVVAHVLLLPGIFAASNPVWLGRYEWYRGVSAKDSSECDQALDRAVNTEPGLVGAWVQWAQAAEFDGNELSAWQRLVGGLAHNPTSVPLIENLKRLWQHLNLEQRLDATKVLSHYFGDRSEVWLDQIRSFNSNSQIESEEKVINLSEDRDVSQFRLDQKVELPTMGLRSIHPVPPVPLIPIDGNDAAEGESL